MRLATLLSAAILCACAQTAEPPRFELASVKISSKPYLVIVPQRSGGRITWTTSLPNVVSYAYNVPIWRLQGTVPPSDHIYEFDAVTDASTADEQVRRMFQTLLAERFKLTIHRESKETDGYVLTLGKSGLKIPEAKEGAPPPEMPEWFRKRGTAPAVLEGKVVSTAEAPGTLAITARRVSMQQFADSLQRSLRVPVLDETGAAGKYYFAFEYAAPDAPDQVNLPDLQTAVQQFGLKLTKHRGPVEMIVIDHVEKTPTEN